MVLLVLATANLAFAAPRVPSATVVRSRPPLACLEASTYEHDGWRLAFRRKAAAAGHENDPPLLLVHPVGIGLSSWFWKRFIAEWQGGEVFAPDLIGCGQLGDSWDPDERGLFLPLDWVRGCEALWREHIQRPCVVVTQGGLAPVGAVLASREADNWRGSLAVAGLVLASPPTWQDMTVAKPVAEVERNYAFLRTPLGGASVALLENRAAIRFFSNLFLFEEEADAAWLDEACADCSAAVRAPVLAFNAGLLSARDYSAELCNTYTPTLVLSGTTDKREADRRLYASQMLSCRLGSVRGCNVLPWESPRETCDAVRAFAAGLSA